MALRIYLTGRVAIECSQGLLDQDAFGGRQGVLLFARLLLPRTAAVSRPELAALLWDDALPRAWETALNAVISKLRTVLGQAGLNKAEVLPAALGCYQLRLPADAWVDVEAASDCLHEAEAALRRDAFREAWAASQVAYHITRRSFLAGESGEWVEAKRENLATVHARACESLAQAYICNGEPGIAADVARQGVAAQPFRESSYRILMKAHAAAGNRAEALRAYETCRRLISDQLGVPPSAETEAVYLEILRSR
jgi:SARP family transcriptional regulator, regulator of embCAB operon